MTIVEILNPTVQLDYVGRADQALSNNEQLKKKVCPLRFTVGKTYVMV